MCFIILLQELVPTVFFLVLTLEFSAGQENYTFWILEWNLVQNFFQLNTGTKKYSMIIKEAN